MKKLGFGILLVVSCIMMASWAFAQETEQAKGCRMGMVNISAPSMSPMMGMMKMAGNLVATSDGGVVVMVDNKLYKYDKNLNLKKEVEIKRDMKNMHRMKECPTMPNKDQEKIKTPTNSDDTSGHGVHHPQ